MRERGGNCLLRENNTGGVLAAGGITMINYNSINDRIISLLTGANVNGVVVISSSTLRTSGVCQRELNKHCLGFGPGPGDNIVDGVCGISTLTSRLEGGLPRVGLSTGPVGFRGTTCSGSFLSASLIVMTINSPAAGLLVGGGLGTLKLRGIVFY